LHGTEHLNPISNDKPIDFYRVALVDDHQNVHDAVSAVLKNVDDIRLVGHAYRGEDAVELTKTAKPDLILMDVVMPGMSGATATKAVLMAYPGTKILVLSSYVDYENIKEMLDSGAVGYLVKDVIAVDLVDTIRHTCRGNSVIFSPEVARLVLAPPTVDSTPDFGLTEREHQVLKHLAEGQTNGEIAEVLNISQPTVRFHTNNILLKLKVETRSQALILAAKSHLV
jgi:NarL family two-component system response regulator LiaR